MNTSELLERLLRGQASGVAQNRGSADGGFGKMLGGLLGIDGATNTGSGSAREGLGGLLGGFLGGGGSGLGRSPGRASDSNYATLASIGMMAFQAYQVWQRSQGSAAEPEIPQTANLLAGPEVELHSHAVLGALIAAAKADGEIDSQEQLMISGEISKHTDDPQLKQWFADELAKPLNANEVGQSANGNPAIAAEMYLASVMLVDVQQDAERNYLNELATALNIDAPLQVHLEQQVKGSA